MTRLIRNGFCWGFAAILIAAHAAGATYTGVTTNMPVYTVNDQTDTWTDSTVGIWNNLILESNATVNLIGTTVDYLRPLTTASRQTNYVGRSGPSALYASNSTMNVTYEYYIGVSNSSTVTLIDSTLRAERDPLNGTFNLYIGRLFGPHTGTLELVNSRLLYNNVNMGSSIWVGHGGCGHLTLHRSTIGSGTQYFENLTSFRSWTASPFFLEPSKGFFNASTVLVVRCAVGGDPVYSANNGAYTFTNNCLLKLGRKPSWNTYPGLYVGINCGLGYTSTVTVSGSRVENLFQTVVGQEAKTGRGILTFLDNAVGFLNDTVTLGVKRSPTWGPSFGHLAIRSGAQVFATNTIASSRLTVGEAGRGLLTLDGGACRAYRFYATNRTDSVIDFKRGLLAINMGVISNQTGLTVGDGGGAATLEHWGGGRTDVFGDLIFAPQSGWKIDADATTTPVLDVRGDLTFASGTILSLPTAQPDLKALDGRVIATADAVEGLPTVTDDPNLRVRVLPDGARETIILRYSWGMIFMLR